MKFLEKLEELNDYLQSDFFDKSKCQLFTDIMFNGNAHGWIMFTMRHLDYDDIEMEWTFDEWLLDENNWEKGHYPKEGIKDIEELLIYLMECIKEFASDAVNEGGISNLCYKMRTANS